MRPGWKLDASSAVPTFEIGRSRPRYGTPSNVAVPEVGVTSPSSMRRDVVLPAPFGPRKPVTTPGSTVKLRSSTACTSPNRLVAPRNSIVVPVTSPLSRTGSRQSTAAAPCCARRSFARLKDGIRRSLPRPTTGLDALTRDHRGLAQHRAQRAGIPAPEDGHQRRSAIDECPDRALRDRLPALATVRTRDPGLHGEHSVEQHDALIRPCAEVTVGDWGDAEVVVQFL